MLVKLYKNLFDFLSKSTFNIENFMRTSLHLHQQKLCKLYKQISTNRNIIIDRFVIQKLQNSVFDFNGIMLTRPRICRVKESKGTEQKILKCNLQLEIQINPANIKI